MMICSSPKNTKNKKVLTEIVATTIVAIPLTECASTATLPLMPIARYNVLKQTIGSRLIVNVSKFSSV